MSLGTYKGRDVIQSAVKVTNAGDGLSKSLGIEPRDFAPGEPVLVLLECVYDGEAHRPIKDTDCFRLETILKAGTATIIDTPAARKAIEQTKNKVQLAAEKAAGVQRIPGTEPSTGDDIDDDENDELD